MTKLPVASSLTLLILFSVACAAPARVAQGRVAPLVIGETLLLPSAALGETRRINVFAPSGYAEDSAMHLPVLYMPDGGIKEDFLHIAGLLQISIANGTMRPFLFVGIENTERRRDLTGPTRNEEDKKIAPRVGGSAAFRHFIRSELMPYVNERYRTTDERAIMGESLAGLFVVETLFLEPDLFDTYIAIDPSLWWSHDELVTTASSRLARIQHESKRLYLASSGQPELAALAERLHKAVATADVGIVGHYRQLPTEAHATVYHPASTHAAGILQSFRAADARCRQCL